MCSEREQQLNNSLIDSIDKLNTQSSNHSKIMNLDSEKSGVACASDEKAALDMSRMAPLFVLPTVGGTNNRPESVKSRVESSCEENADLDMSKPESVKSCDASSSEENADRDMSNPESVKSCVAGSSDERADLDMSKQESLK